MLELTGLGSVLRSIGFLYWLLAIGALALVLIKLKSVRSKTIGAIVVIAIFGFIPVKAMIEQYQRDQFAKEAWAYFKKKCETEAGEKIYKTFTGVKSVLVVKPLPPATEKDLYDQYWMGDPYSDDLEGRDRGERAAAKLIGRREFIKDYSYANNGYDFIEFRIGQEGNWSFLRFTPLTTPPFVTKSEIDRPESRFGILWDDISTAESRKYWVAGSRLRIHDLNDDSVVAERIGYFIEAGFGSTVGQRRPWQASRAGGSTCPEITNRDHANRFFVLKVLASITGGGNGK